MKRKILFFLLVAASLFVTAPVAKAQAVEQGNFMIEGYYGFPNLMTSLLRTVAKATTDDPNLKIGGLGPLGGRVQYMLSDEIGLGIDFYYANSSVSYTDQTTDTNGNPVSYTYKLTSSRPRFLLRMDYHIEASDKIDPYAAVGLGYSASKYTVETNDPYVDIDSYSLRKLIPVAFRVAFGAKFYFVKFLGVGAEVGLGGPLFTGGVTAKF